jgi:hypothetical protein
MKDVALISQCTASVGASAHTPAIPDHELWLAERLTAIRAGDGEDIPDVTGFDIAPRH